MHGLAYLPRKAMAPDLLAVLACARRFAEADSVARLAPVTLLLCSLSTDWRGTFRTFSPSSRKSTAVSLKTARGVAGMVRNWSLEGNAVAEIRAKLANECGLPSEPVPDASPTQGPVVATPPIGVPTLESVTAVWFDRKRRGLKNGKHIAQNWTTLKTYVFPALGHRPIGDIVIREVVEVFRPIWHEKNETARRTLGRVREVFELAKLEHGLQSNPADFAVDVAYGKARRRTRHFGALPPERMPEFWTWLKDVRCEEDPRRLIA